MEANNSPRSLSILLAERSSFSQRGLEALQAIAPTEACDLSQAELAEKAAQHDILLVRLGLRVDAAVLRAAPRLQVIASPTTGLDHIDLAEAERCGVTVLSLKGERQFLETVTATAEHTFALLLCLLRRIPSAFEAVKQGEWRRDRFRGRELNGQTLGIIGYGRLGRMVARYGLAFGMRVLVYDPYFEPEATPLLPGMERCSTLDELLEQSEVVSLHVPLNAETSGMISTGELKRMKAGAVLINTARGAVVDEAALLEALISGRLAGAAVDVLCNEPHIRPELLDYARRHDNLIITPHIGGATQESVEKADLFLAKKIADWVAAHGGAVRRSGPTLS